MSDIQILEAKSGQRYIKANKRVVLEKDDVIFLKNIEDYFNGLAGIGVMTSEEAALKIEKTPKFVLANGTASKKNKGSVTANTGV